jgi:cell division protease FtsH
MGVERKSLIISDDEKRLTAYHESGHVLVAKSLPGMDPIHKVTIIPRGMALGLTQALPIDERRTYSRTYCQNQLAYMLGGRAAEKLVLGDLSTGAGNDIEKATKLARKMVCEWGMSDKLGPLTYGEKQEEIFLGREIGMHRDYSEDTAREIDEEVKKIISEAGERAETILKKKIKKLKILAKTLLEREILTGDEIEEIVGDGKKKRNRKKSN